MPGVYGSVDQSGSGVRVSYLNEVADFLCDAVRFSTSLQEFLSRRSLLSQGYCFYAGLCERGLSRGFRGVYRSLLWHVPFTVNPPLFLRPLRVNGMGGVSLAPHDPRHCAENGRYAVCSTPASSGGPGRTRRPCLDRSSDHRHGGQSWMCACVPARSPVAQETVACGTSRERNIPQNTCPEVRKLLSRQPPFTGIALVHDKQKKAGHLKWPA